MGDILHVNHTTPSSAPHTWSHLIKPNTFSLTPELLSYVSEKVKSQKFKIFSETQENLLIIELLRNEKKNLHTFYIQRCRVNIPLYRGYSKKTIKPKQTWNAAQQIPSPKSSCPTSGTLDSIFYVPKSLGSPASLALSPVAHRVSYGTAALVSGCFLSKHPMFLTALIESLPCNLGFTSMTLNTAPYFRSSILPVSCSTAFWNIGGSFYSHLALTFCMPAKPVVQGQSKYLTSAQDIAWSHRTTNTVESVCLHG